MMLIDPIARGQDLLDNDSSCLPDLDVLVSEIKKI